MADRVAKHPVGTQMLYPDGAGYLYLQSADNFEKGTYVELNVNDRLCKFKGGLKFPFGIVLENVEKEDYTFIMVRPPQQREKPVVG